MPVSSKLLPLRLLTAILFSCGVASAELVPRDVTISSSRQFVVRADDREVRLRAVSFAEELRAVWNEALGLKGAWEFPVRIEVAEEGRRRVRRSVVLNVMTGDRNEPWVQLSLSDPAMIGSPELAEWIFQALALEYTARFYPPAPNSATRLAPQWLVQALVQQWQGRRNPVPVQLVEGLLSGPKPPTVASIVRQRNPLPSTAEQVTFRLLSLGLLRTLAETKEGRAGIRELVGRLGDGEIDQAAIMKAFPSLENKPERLERQWALTLARLAYTSRVRLLTFSATERELQNLFSIEGELPRRGEDPEKVRGPLAMLPVARSPGGQRAMNGLTAMLIQLEMRAHPLYAAIIQEYRLIAQSLARRPKTSMRKRIEENIALQEKVRAMGESVADVLNTFEVNREGASDPQFQKMLRVQSALIEPEPRRDAISRALDSFESSQRK